MGLRLWAWQTTRMILTRITPWWFISSQPTRMMKLPDFFTMENTFMFLKLIPLSLSQLWNFTPTSVRSHQNRQHIGHETLLLWSLSARFNRLFTSLTSRTVHNVKSILGSPSLLFSETISFSDTPTTATTNWAFMLQSSCFTSEEVTLPGERSCGRGFLWWEVHFLHMLPDGTFLCTLKKNSLQ